MILRLTTVNSSCWYIFNQHTNAKTKQFELSIETQTRQCIIDLYVAGSIWVLYWERSYKRVCLKERGSIC